MEFTGLFIRTIVLLTTFSIIGIVTFNVFKLIKVHLLSSSSKKDIKEFEAYLKNLRF